MKRIRGPQWRNRSRAALAALLLSSALVAPSLTRASDDAEIPGVPLPGASFSGTVGGAAVDRVYAVDVPAGSVLIATLVGASGSELGLYLYSTAATSVLEDVPIASSAKPGGNQGISVSLRVAGTYYLNVNGRNTDRAYAFTLTTAVRRDTTAPILSLADAVSPSRSSNVCVRVAASDGLSGVAEAALTLPGESVQESDWQRYLSAAGRVCASLPLEEGERQVVLRVRNGAGLVTASGRLDVRIDDTLPQVARTSPASSLLLAPRAPISWTFSEPVRIIGPLTSAVYAFDQSNRPIPGAATVSSSGLTVTWTPSSGIPAGSVVLATLGAVRDIAGNVQEAVPTLVMERKRPTSLAIDALVRLDDAIRVRLTASANLVGSTLYVERREEGAWVRVREFTLAAAVSTLRIPTASSDRVRIRWEGDDTRAPAVSGSLRTAP